MVSSWCSNDATLVLLAITLLQHNHFEYSDVLLCTVVSHSETLKLLTWHHDVTKGVVSS